ncbi:MAG: enoyl-CoA hydratase/isomerase family protein [Bacteroidales bacterium]|nr:enoyl-CoA hydratase/isomerase family protein [Bacteroidales bacterium]
MKKDLKYILWEIKDDLCTLHLNRPSSRNALNLELIEELLTVFDDIENNLKIRFVVISAMGDAFCSGADLEWMTSAIDLSYEENRRESAKLAELFYRLCTLRKITIAKVFGACIGGGVGLAAACDIVIGSTDTYFKFSEVKLGLIPSTIAPYIINRTGLQRCKYYVLTSERIDPVKANEMNLIDILASPEKIDNELEELISTLRSGGIKAQDEIKKLFSKFQMHLFPKNYKTDTADIIASLRISSEGKEGIRAFLEKREPEWKR